MIASHKKISIITKIFSVFLAITALDLSAIYIFTATGQIDQISRNGLLVAENAALKILQLLQGVALRDPLVDAAFRKKIAAASESSAGEMKDCATIAPDGKPVSDSSQTVSPRALKALRLYETEGRLFFTDLALGDFSADVFVPFRPGTAARLYVFTCKVPLASIRESFDRLLRLSMIILAVTLLMQAGLAWFIYIIFIRRLRSLEKATIKIGQGDFSEAFKTGRRSDEIDHLAQTFDEMRLALAEKTRVLEDTLLDLEKANFNLEGDLILGEEIQQSILPEKSAGKNLKWLVTYRPLSKVSGDLYDVYDLTGGATGILEFDASGHGVPAALLTMMAKTAFVEAIQKTIWPNQVIAFVNDELSAHLQKTGNFLTAFYAVVRPNGKMVYCNAAHTQTVVLRAGGKIELLDPTSLSIGFAPPGGDSFKAAEVDLHSGDRVIIYTDGLTETVTKTGKPFETTGLMAELGKNRGLDLAAMHAAILNGWNAQIERSAVEDDITLVSFEFR
jgi:sigma-B regulation protein RsbU (phosphoserine phosphatase)